GRSIRVRPHPYAARQGQGRGLPPRGQADRPDRRGARGGAAPQPDARPPPRRRRRARRRHPHRRAGRRHRQDRRPGGRLPRDRRGRAAQPLLRLWPGGGQPGRATGPQRLRGPDPRRRRRVDEPGAHGLRRRRLGHGPRHRADHRLRAAGHRRRPDRHPRRLGPRRGRRLRRRVPPPRGQGVGQRLLRPLRGAGHRHQWPDRARPRRADPPRHLAGGAGPPHAELRLDGPRRRLRRRRPGEVPLGRADRPRPPRRQLLRHRGRRRDHGHRQRAGRRRARAHAARPHRGDRRVRRRPHDHAHRPRPRRPQGAGQGRPRGVRHRPVGDERGVRRRGDALHPGHGHQPRDHQRQRRCHRDGPPAGSYRSHDPRHARRRARAPRPEAGPGHPLCRRGHGRRHHRRARL
ncbi:MAG: 3-ketoacyl-CoA thiolase @ Acetyl-CoA acetyltransferase, partial [uncultured Nocardioides sp.]